MYKNVKLFLMILFPFFISLDGMQKDKVINKFGRQLYYSKTKGVSSVSFQKKFFTSQSRDEERDLVTYYLESEWYFPDSSFQTIKQGSEILIKYGPCVYAQCTDSLRRENMRQLFAHNSAMAEKNLKKLKLKKILDISTVTLNILAISHSMVFEDESFFMASFFAANCFSAFYAIKRINENSRETQVYQDIIDACKAIERHDNFKSQISDSNKIFDIGASITNYDETQQKN